MASYVPEWHIVDMAKQLRRGMVESRHYSYQLFAYHRAASEQRATSSKVRGTSKIVSLDEKKSSRLTLKYTYATWLRYFYGDLASEDAPLELGPATP